MMRRFLQEFRFGLKRVQNGIHVFFTALNVTDRRIIKFYRDKYVLRKESRSFTYMILPISLLAL